MTSDSFTSFRYHVRYVRHIHEYTFPVSADPSGNSGDEPICGVEQAMQVGEWIFQRRENYVVCNHNVPNFPWLPTSWEYNYFSFLRGLPHLQRDCRPCGKCYDVLIQHCHACPPSVVGGSQLLLEGGCTVDCMVKGRNSRPSWSHLRRAHHCPWVPGERDPLMLAQQYCARSRAMAFANANRRGDSSRRLLRSTSVDSDRRGLLPLVDRIVSRFHDP